ncbi:MAG: hypothetical protein R2867_17395 [Caldilineaceae bacterium]
MTSLYADAENVHWGTLFDSSDRMVTEPMVGKLAEWAKQGKLHWLDLHDSALPLVNTRIAEFPYDQIDGFGQPFIYRKRPKPRWFWQRRNWSPDGEIRDWSEKQLLR